MKRQFSTKEETRRDELPIHFFTIVLNGQPFIRYHHDVFQNLPFKWHWHIVEGVAELKHDTAWSLQFGGKIKPNVHFRGLSIDGTSGFLNDLQTNFPNQITLYRKDKGQFWDGKVEMVNAPLANIRENCLLWQIDVDEFWTVEQISKVRSMFIEEPSKTAAYYFCHYFVGPNLVTTTKETYGNHSGEWLRTWRYKTGLSWSSHEPPRLTGQLATGERMDVASIARFEKNETEQQGLVFQHYAYVLESQLQFKESYYGYRNALEGWQKLQRCSKFPVLLKEYFPWVQDETQVDTITSQNIIRLAAPSYFPSEQSQRILFVRTDSIGDSILASSMLAPIRKRFPNAEIIVLCQEHIAPVYEACPFINRVETIDKEYAYREESYKVQVLERLKSLKIDLVLNSVYSREPMTDIVSLGCMARETVAFNSHHCNCMTVENRDRVNTYYSRLLPGGEAHKPELIRHKDFLDFLGIKDFDLKPEIWLTADDEKFAEDFYRTNDLLTEKTIILFAGTQYREKIYPNFGAVVDRICREQGFKVIAIGSKAERAINEKTLSEIEARSFNLAGVTTVRQAAAILKRARLAVGGDTAGGHMACAVGIPNVIVLGGGHFGRFFPYSKLTSVVCLPLSCYGCSWNCRYNKCYCTQDISPEIVTRAIRETLLSDCDKPRVFVQNNSMTGGDENAPMWQMFSEFLDPSKVKIIPMSSGKEIGDELQENFHSAAGLSENYWKEVGRILSVINDLRHQGRVDKADRLAEEAIRKYHRSIHLVMLRAEIQQQLSSTASHG